MGFSTTSLLKRDDKPETETSLYGYVPTEYVCIIFVVLFGLSTAIHLGQSIRFRMWWILPTVILAGFGEVIGWSGRLWSSQNPESRDPYLMQITTTIIAPTPLVAANFIILGRIIAKLGSRYSRLSPKWYTIVFCTSDFVSLVVQAVGGATASMADTDKDAKVGGNIMLGGIIFQMVSITVYVLCAGEFFLRFLHDQPVRGTPESHKLEGPRAPMGKRLRIMIYALGFNTLCLFIRAIYRTIELSDGWNGRIISTQVYFNVLDGAMIVLAIYTLNFFHPGFLLKEAPKEFAYPKATGSQESSKEVV